MSTGATPGSATQATSAENRVMMVAPAAAEEACAHFRGRLAFEADPADVARDLADGTAGFTLIDCRPTGNYLKAHLPGAVSPQSAGVSCPRRTGRRPSVGWPSRTQYSSPPIISLTCLPWAASSIAPLVAALHDGPQQ